MPFFRVLAVLAVASLAAASGAAAGSATGKSAGKAGPKGQKPPAVAMEAQPAAVAEGTPPSVQAAEEAPIVMGRSVAIVRKSKLRHIKAQPTHPTLPSQN